MAGKPTLGANKRGPMLVSEIVQRIIRDTPRITDLGKAKLEKLTRMAVAERLRDDIRRAIDLERIDYVGERARFLSRASRTGSAYTRRAYSAALDRLDAWCAKQGVAPVELSPAQADDWIESLKADGRSPASVRLDVSGASAFFTWMERRHPMIRNTFRGTKARPIGKTTRTTAVPTDAEIQIMAGEANPALRAAIVTMAEIGLRVGGLPGLSITGTKWTTRSKGKDIAGNVPESVSKAIERAGLPPRDPFAGRNARGIGSSFYHLAEKLHKAGRIARRYSVHGLRHACAVRLYRESHDIYRVRTALCHASVRVTEIYLRSLGY